MFLIAGNERESFDPDSVVLALPCPTPRKAAAPGRVAAEVSPALKRLIYDIFPT